MHLAADRLHLPHAEAEAAQLAGEPHEPGTPWLPVRPFRMLPPSSSTAAPESACARARDLVDDLALTSNLGSFLQQEVEDEPDRLAEQTRARYCPLTVLTLSHQFVQDRPPAFVEKTFGAACGGAKSLRAFLVGKSPRLLYRGSLPFCRDRGACHGWPRPEREGRCTILVGQKPGSLRVPDGLALGNRHGLVAGATGTGKTVTAAEARRRLFRGRRVPVFLV